MDDARFITDYRQADSREQYIMAINSIVRNDDYRTFLQQNAKKIMDNEWNILKQKKSCHTNCCIHKSPTRTTPGANFEELNLYNAVRTNVLQKTNKNYPFCSHMEDYRSTF